MIKESSSGLRPAQMYSQFNVQLRYANIFIPMDLNMLKKPIYFSAPSPFQETYWPKQLTFFFM